MEVHDSLPYIDTEISEAQRATAQRLILRELPAKHQDLPHPSMQAFPEPRFSDLVRTELARVASGKAREGGIDLARYEAPDEPSEDSDIEAWRQALRNAYTSSTYLSGRGINLSLLEELGKNAWLIGNSQLEDILNASEKQLANLKRETDDVNRARKTAQEGSKAEILGLEDNWRLGVGRIIEVQVATQELRQELQRRRKAAVT